MKELICFAIGVVVGVVIMKRSQAVDELRKELEREKAQNRFRAASESAS